LWCVTSRMKNVWIVLDVVFHFRPHVGDGIIVVYAVIYFVIRVAHIDVNYRWMDLNLKNPFVSVIFVSRMSTKETTFP
jgi:hypothetical protein